MKPGVIGFVSFGDGSILAELLGVDNWRVTRIGGGKGTDWPEMARNLTALYKDTYRGPQDGYYGQLILRDLAERTGGAYAYDSPPPSPPDEIP